MQVSDADDNVFITRDVVDFSDDTDRELTIYETDSISGEATFYLVKKYVQAISAQITN